MKVILTLFISFFLIFATAQNVRADEASKIGVHILNPAELDSAKKLVEMEDSDEWQYVTIPFTLEDVKRPSEWQAFFYQAREKKIIPLVRIATKFEDEAWKVPNRKEIVMMLTMLGALEWPTDDRNVIIFNEVNHAKEWGGTIDPEGYASVFRFASSWARSENKNFVVLPAAMDLAAPNGSATKEAFAYLDEMHQSDAEIFSYVDVWNSHSYPNPAFSASPQKTGKNSLRGFEYELAYLKEKTGDDFDVYITETGWEDNAQTRRWLTSYYEYALRHIWSDARVIGVTPFVLKGAPGPFAGFSFLNSDDSPSRQYLALRTAIEKLQLEERLLTDAGLAE